MTMCGSQRRATNSSVHLLRCTRPGGALGRRRHAPPAGRTGICCATRLQLLELDRSSGCVAGVRPRADAPGRRPLSPVAPCASRELYAALSTLRGQSSAHIVLQLAAATPARAFTGPPSSPLPLCVIAAPRELGSGPIKLEVEPPISHECYIYCYPIVMLV